MGKVDRLAPKTHMRGLLSFIAILGMGTAREALRMTYLGIFEYSIYDYPVNVDWGSTALFFGTFVMGLVVMAYSMMVAFKLGRGTFSQQSFAGDLTLSDA